MPTIISADSTPIDATSTGSGPGLVVIPGGLRRSHHYRRLAPVGPLPMPAATALAWFLLRTPPGRETRSLLPTLPAEMRVTAGLDSDGSRYAAITSPTLVIAGGRSPGWLRRTPPRLAELIPHARYALMPELDHNAPDENAPAAVADLVRAFLTTDDAEAR